MSHHAAVSSRHTLSRRSLGLLALLLIIAGCSRTEEAGSGPPTSAVATAEASAVEVVVKLDPALAGKVSPDDKVFIFARAAHGPKAPLAAVQKQVKDLPVAVLLDDSMAMMPEGRISAFPELVFGARVSRSGDAVAKAGDLEGSTGPVRADETKSVEVTIAREIADRPAIPNLLPLLEGTRPASKADHPKSAKRLAVSIPPEVAAKWKAVDLALTPSGGETQTLRVSVGREAAVKNSTSVVRVVAFAPAFQITDNGVTSSSNNAENPAVLVRVLERGQPVAEGWVFQKLPEFNTLETGKLHVRLIGGHTVEGK